MDGGSGRACVRRLAGRCLLQAQRGAHECPVHVSAYLEKINLGLSFRAHVI